MEDRKVDNQRTLKLQCFVVGAISICCIVIGVLVGLQSRMVVMKVEGSSMEPSFYSGDLITVRRMSKAVLTCYLRIVPNCVVVAETDLGIVVKRVSGISGDTVYWVDEYGVLMETCIDEGYVFLIGDNEEESLDSRSEAIGQVPVECIRGVVVGKVPWVQR